MATRRGSRFHASLDRRRWARARQRAFRGDGWRCVHCGKAGRLEAHHEPPLRAGAADPYALAGLVTLCRACHIARHRGDSETPGRAAWREFLTKLVT